MMATDLKLNRLTVAILITLGVVVILFILSNVRGGQSYTSENVKLSELISASTDLARRGGKRVVEIRNMNNAEIGKLSKGLTKEGKKEYVTVGDKVRGTGVHHQHSKTSFAYYATGKGS